MKEQYSLEEVRDLLNSKEVRTKKFKRKRIEFSKVLVIVVLLIGLYHQHWSYKLAEQDKYTNPEVTVAITTVIVGTCVGYLAKSFLEKKSRNDNKLDENGVPYDISYNNEGEI